MKSKKINGSKELSGNAQATIGLQNNPLQREQMIAVAAYYHAEKRGFAPNDEMADWFESEREIDSLLNVSSS